MKIPSVEWNAEICSTKSTWGEMWEQILDTAAEVTVADIAEIVKKKETC